jgi:hypothetical protein
MPASLLATFACEHVCCSHAMFQTVYPSVLSQSVNYVVSTTPVHLQQLCNLCR